MPSRCSATTQRHARAPKPLEAANRCSSRRRDLPPTSSQTSPLVNIGGLLKHCPLLSGLHQLSPPNSYKRLVPASRSAVVGNLVYSRATASAPPCASRWRAAANRRQKTLEFRSPVDGPGQSLPGLFSALACWPASTAMSPGKIGTRSPEAIDQDLFELTPSGCATSQQHPPCDCPQSSGPRIPTVPRFHLKRPWEGSSRPITPYLLRWRCVSRGLLPEHWIALNSEEVRSCASGPTPPRISGSTTTPSPLQRLAFLEQLTLAAPVAIR